MPLVSHELVMEQSHLHETACAKIGSLKYSWQMALNIDAMTAWPYRTALLLSIKNVLEPRSFSPSFSFPEDCGKSPRISPWKKLLRFREGRYLRGWTPASCWELPKSHEGQNEKQKGCKYEGPMNWILSIGPFEGSNPLLRGLLHEQKSAEFYRWKQYSTMVKGRWFGRESECLDFRSGFSPH